MIKVVLSWVVVIYVMVCSAVTVIAMFEKIIWNKDILTTNPIESFITYLFSTAVVVISTLVTMYVTGLWTP